MKLSAWYHGAWAVFRFQISCMVVEFHLQMVSVLEGKLPLSLGKILLFWPNIMPFRNFVPTQTFGAPELDRQPGVETWCPWRAAVKVGWSRDDVPDEKIRRSFWTWRFQKKWKRGQLRLFGLKWCLFYPSIHINCMWSKWPLNWFDRWSS